MYFGEYFSLVLLKIIFLICLISSKLKKEMITQRSAGMGIKKKRKVFKISMKLLKSNTTSFITLSCTNTGIPFVIVMIGLGSFWGEGYHLRF